jgi:hypothetical protein
MGPLDHAPRILAPSLGAGDLRRHRGHVRSERGTRIDHSRAPPTHDVAAGPFESEGTRISRIYPVQI